MRIGLALLALVALDACASPTAPSLTTGLTGVVLRGPIRPVCQIQLPCDAPFSADFSVEQNGRRLAGFRSDADGRFTVMLAPGIYRILPAADAPMMAPHAQAKTVEVLAVGLTAVQLHFDTGLR